MRHWPLNRHHRFEVWPHFDAGRFIDSNPSVVDTPAGRFAVIRRDAVPPRPGHGQVWAVAVDQQLRPTGVPQLLLPQAEDPRAIWLDGRMLVFHVRMEHRADGHPVGCAMAVAEFVPEGGQLTLQQQHLLPKYPLGAREGAGLNAGWEKNWVPFVAGPGQVALIYSHAPWEVMLLEAPADAPTRRFSNAWRAEGLQWAWGGVRGGTPPVRWAEGQRITFFHSSMVAGSRKVYVTGAAVFEDKPPYAPVLMTADPLLVAPYTTTVLRHGWPFAISVIFPLGAQEEGGAFRLLCGLDDGEIGSFTIDRAELAARLQPIAPPPRPSLCRLEEGGALPDVTAPLRLAPPGTAAPDHPTLRFARLLAGRGRRLVDIAAGPGDLSLALAEGYAQVQAFERPGPLLDCLQRNVALNGLRQVQVHGWLPSTASAERLDAFGWNDVDLLQVGRLPEQADALAGAAATITRCQPVLLLRADAAEPPPPALVQQLDALGYDLSPAFPFDRSRLLALPRGRRAEHDWFI